MNNTNGQNQVTQTQERTIADMVINRVEKLSGLNQLDLPADYSAPNALRAAYLQLQETFDLAKRPVLESCTQESIANALFKMVIEGLSVAKGQGAFIAYGNKLTFQRMYAGTLALAKRTAGVVDCRGQVVYKNDEFEYERQPDGRTQVTKHKQSLANIDPNGIIGAYAVVTFEDGSTAAEVMSYEQIKMSWSMNKANNPAHMKFPDQMAIKTVMNRALKVIVNSSSDQAIMGGSDNEIQDIEYDEAEAIIMDPVKASSENTIKENANTVKVNFDDEPNANQEPQPGF